MGRMPRIAVIFTGGTIAMRSVDGPFANVPGLRAEELLARVPGLDAIAQIEPIDWGLVPASHLTLAQVLEIGRLLADALGRPDIDGAVVVQGTDVIEETAYAWDLLPRAEKPVIVVGAMRSASQEGYDGPENLRNAVIAAADPRLGIEGVLVGLAGELHAADDVRKTHTHAYATFGSPTAGPVAIVDRGGVTLVRRRAAVGRLPGVPQAPALPIPLVTAVLDDLEAVTSARSRRPRGLVVAATGGGNTHPALLDAAARLLGDGVPVALTTRCPSGRPLPGYAFPGGSTTWWDAGALFTGTLGAAKSRILLALGVGAGCGMNELATICEPLGGGVRPIG
jgi:L-asparaginase